MYSVQKLTDLMVRIARREARKAVRLEIGRVTVVDIVSSPKTVTVNGKTMVYLSSYTPTVGDRVRYIDGVVLGTITT